MLKNENALYIAFMHARPAQYQAMFSENVDKFLQTPKIDYKSQAKVLKAVLNESGKNINFLKTVLTEEKLKEVVAQGP